SRRAHPIARTGDCHKTGKESVDGEAYVPLFAHEIRVEHRRQTRGASCKRGIRSHSADAFEVHCGERASRIETVPSEPEQQSTAGGDGEIVGHHRAAAVSLELASQAWPENDRPSQRDEATNRMHDRRSGEVVEALSQSGKKVSSRSHSGEEPVRTPRPVTDDWVNEAGHRDTIEKVADKSGATDHRAGSDRRAGVREGELEEPECQERHARRLVRCWSIFQEE